MHICWNLSGIAKENIIGTYAWQILNVGVCYFDEEMDFVWLCLSMLKYNSDWICVIAKIELLSVWPLELQVC